MKEAMRIVHIIAGIAPEHGGPTAVLRELTAELAARGHAVAVVTTDSAGGGAALAPAIAAGEGFAPGVEVIVHPAEVRRSPHPSLRHAAATWRLPERFDVAHVHGLFTLPVSLAMLALRARRMPYVLRPCGMLDAWSLAHKRLRKRTWLALGEGANVRGAARVQASSEHEAAAARACLPAALHDRVMVLPQGVAAPPPPRGRPHARPYVVFLSRLAPKKGLVRLLDAFALIAPRHPELDLALVGPDEHGHRAEVVARVAALGLGARVVVPGAASAQAKSDWLAHAAAFALPSDDENFGVVVVEAAHLGAPILVSDRVGLAPDVAGLGAGVVVERTPAAIAAGLEALLVRGRDAYTDGTRALAARFGWADTIDRLEVIYRAIARSSR